MATKKDNSTTQKIKESTMARIDNLDFIKHNMSVDAIFNLLIDEYEKKQ